jgi:hypothetical protein
MPSGRRIRGGRGQTGVRPWWNPSDAVRSAPREHPHKRVPAANPTNHARTSAAPNHTSIVRQGSRGGPARGTIGIATVSRAARPSIRERTAPGRRQQLGADLLPGICLQLSLDRVEPCLKRRAIAEPLSVDLSDRVISRMNSRADLSNRVSTRTASSPRAKNHTTVLPLPLSQCATFYRQAVVAQAADSNRNLSVTTLMPHSRPPT